MGTILEFRCKHGHHPSDGRYVGLYAAPFSTCQCCGVNFPYTDHGSWSMGSNGPVSGGKSWTKDLCAGCGGHYVDWGNKAA